MHQFYKGWTSEVACLSTTMSLRKGAPCRRLCIESELIHNPCRFKTDSDCYRGGPRHRRATSVPRLGQSSKRRRRAGQRRGHRGRAQGHDARRLRAQERPPHRETPSTSPPSSSPHSPTLTRQVLHQHINFFDLSSTGIISPVDTYTAFRLLEWHILLALLATFVIHTGFSYPSLPPGHWLPDPLFRIRAAGIHQCKHGGDSGAYDNEGRYRAQQLADFFSKYGDRVPRGDGREGEDKDDGEWGMTYAQALHGARSQRCLFDFFGTFAALFECEFPLVLILIFHLTRRCPGTATYITIWPADGIMRMEDVRGVFDGSYFFKVAGDRRARYLSQPRNQ